MPENLVLSTVDKQCVLLSCCSALKPEARLGLGQPGLVGAVPAHGPGAGAPWYLRVLPTQIFCDSLGHVTNVKRGT